MTITVISACGTGESCSPAAATVKGSSPWGGFSWALAKGVDQTRFTPVQVQYPADFVSPDNYLASVAAGVDNGSAIIEGLGGGRFVLTGYSQGAEVVTQILQSLQSGALRAYLPQFLGGVTFGNPMRAPGHSWPGDPTGCTGQGINSQSVLHTAPATWWDMTNVFDLAGNIPLGGAGDLINRVWDVAGLVSLKTSAAALAEVMAVLGQHIPAADALDVGIAVKFLVNAATQMDTLGHSSFDTQAGTTGLTFVQHAIDFVNSLA